MSQKIILKKKMFKPIGTSKYENIENIGSNLIFPDSHEFKKKLLNITDDKYTRNISKIEKKLEIEIIEIYSKNFKLLQKNGHGNLGISIPLDKSSKSMLVTKEDYIGTINLDKFEIENLFKNNNGYTYYRIHSQENSIFYNLFLLKYYDLQQKLPTDEDYKKFIEDNKDKISDYTIFDSDKYCASNYNLKQKIINLINLCKTLSNIFNCTFLLIQDNIIANNSGIKDKNIILCSNDSPKIAFEKDILLFYFFIDSNYICNLEPIIVVNDTEQKIQYLIPANSIEQHKILYEKISVVDDLEQEQNIELKDDIETNKSESYITFNPYDKDIELPQIEIELPDISKKMTYLLGNKYIKNTIDFYNIYEDDDKENNLAGKVNFISDKELEVYWCNNHPKIV